MAAVVAFLAVVIKAVSSSGTAEREANTAGTPPDYVNDVYDVVAEPVTTLTTAQTKTGQKGEAEYL